MDVKEFINFCNYKKLFTKLFEYEKHNIKLKFL